MKYKKIEPMEGRKLEPIMGSLAGTSPGRKHPGGRPKKPKTEATTVPNVAKEHKKSGAFLKKPQGLSVTEWKTDAFTVRVVSDNVTIMRNADGLSLKLPKAELNSLVELARYVGRVCEC